MTGVERGVEAGGDRSVAAGGNIGRVATGDYVTQVERAILLPPEALAPAACPDGLVNIPRKAVRFVGRERELGWLDAYFDGPDHHVVAVRGLGGIGKSTLAARWAALRAEGHRPTWWITAESRADLDAGLAALAGAMQPALIDVLPQEALRERALQWLATHDGWLLVLDNVTVAADVEALLSRVARRGRILITTRQAGGWDGLAEVLALTVPDVDDSYAMFAQAVTGLGDGDDRRARKLCATLGHLPLAVAQAAAYCAETRTTPGEYLDQLRQYPGELYETTPGDGRQAVAWTWRLTLDRLVAADPLTGTILRVLAWWGPDRIPRDLLDRLGPTPRVRRAVGRLAAHSMVTLHEDGAASVHRLVQAVARTADASDPHRCAEDIDRARLLAEEALAAALPQGADGRAEWSAWRELFPHVETYVGQVDPADDTERTAAMLHQGARFLVSDRDLTEAALWFERAVVCRARVLGEDHPQTSASREGVAECWAIGWDLEPSVELQARVVADLERVLGEDRAETHVARGRLAITWRHLGDTEGAVELLEGALAGLERLRGPAHRDTLLVRSHLGVAYQDAGRLEDAIALHERTLDERRSLLGPDHPETLTSRLNLARLYEAMGEVERAAADFDAVVDDAVRALGEDHPFTTHLMHVEPPGGWRHLPPGWLPGAPDW
ncbi:tetratricopeptide repeat-containing protein [Streptomyces sp. NPDC050848]|uniref:tetratricopeptide repeat-containing protein n=1 Tax=Streptomyces sp. NPDC050848 TaxID=3155791 RepID=UPI0033D7DF1F